MLPTGSIDAAAAMVNRFAREAWRGYQIGDLTDETRVSQEIASRTKWELPLIMPDGFKLQARCFQSSGAKLSGDPADPKTEEGMTGADLLFVLRRVTRRLAACAGFIAQAKLSPKLRTSQEWGDFIGQAATMEEFAPGLGYGVVYSATTRVSPAGLIAGLPNPGVGTQLPPNLVWRQHFREFFAGRLGDSRACDLLRTGFIEHRRQESGLTALLPGRSLVAVDMLLTDSEAVDARAEWLQASHAPQFEELSREPPLDRR